LIRLLLCIALAALTAWPSGAETPAPASAARVEARSQELLAVGLVHDDKMSIHVSRLIDNAPVRDAVVTVVLRGTAHPTTAETDGSYALESKDLTLPGAATVEFQVSQGGASESLKGTLDIAQAAGQPEDKNSARQLWWWVLNFAVCFGVLWLISRRRKAAKA
jgi:cobalt-zinc-cadmium efflux system membrane fusion protein